MGVWNCSDGKLPAGLTFGMKMLHMISMLAFIAIATALPSSDTIVPEVELQQEFTVDWRKTVAQDAQDQITLLLQEGKDDGACADLAAATLDEVDNSVAAQQSILNALDDGSSCPKEGQDAVDAAQSTLESATAALTDAEKAFSDAQNAPVSVAPKPFSTLTEGNCDFFFSDSSYTSAKAAFASAKTALDQAKGAEKAASDALSAAKEAQEKAIRECQCSVRSAYNKAWLSANAQNEENEKAYTKGKHMQCVLEGTDPNDCSVGEVPKVHQVTLADGVPQEECATFEHVSYIGCYGDNGHRDLKHGPKNYGFSATNCRRHCKNYKYFALQNGGWCNCDNSYGDNYSGSGGKGNYNKYPDSQCNVGGVTAGRGMGGGWLNAIYESKPSTGGVRLSSDDMVNWVGHCSATKRSENDEDRFRTGDIFSCASGSNQMRSKKVYTAPLTFSLEMYQSGSAGDECGVFGVFGAVNNRHSGFSAGRGWWAHYLGYGYNNAQGHGINENRDGETKRWTQMTVSVASNGVATYWVEGQKYATISSGWASASGYLTIGMNCRKYAYQNLVVQEGVSW